MTGMNIMRIEARHIGKGHAVEAHAPDGKLLQFDGEGGSFGPTPMQHLLAAVGACSVMDVAHILDKKRIAYSDLRVECIGERPDAGHPRPFESVKLVFHVRGDVPQKALDEAARLSVEKYCNVGATLGKALRVGFDAIVD